MTGRISVSRAAAVRAAQEAKARRDAQRRRRERQVESALADYYEGTAKAAALREQAAARADKMIKEADEAAREPERAAHDAVRALRELGETREQIAELTGLGTAEVRSLLAGPTHAAPDTARPVPAARATAGADGAAHREAGEVAA